VADHRADIFSLGAVLHEMLTGRRAFPGTSPAELISSILPDEPPLPSESDPRIPKALDLIVQHCLEKNPDERFQSARDLAFHLDSLGGSVTQRGAIEPLPERRRWPRLVLLGLAALLLLGLVLLDTRTGRATTVLPALAQGLSLSADERWVTYIEPHAEADVWMATLPH
jgi:eukaryotic-like serine/threonine-protein kinase